MMMQGMYSMFDIFLLYYANLGLVVLVIGGLFISDVPFHYLSNEVQ